MKDVKEKLAPIMKSVDQLDTEAVLAICGVLLLLSLILGGVADLIAMLIGVVMGMAVHKKIF